jgi:hypothetical protein
MIIYHTHKPRSIPTRARGFGKATMTGKKEKPNRNPNLGPPWKKGQSANPHGRPPRDVQQSALLARIGDHGDEALDTIIQVMRKTRPSHGDNIKLKAATDELDRIIGRPTQSLAASVIQRTVAADGTLIEGSAMMSPLLQAALLGFCMLFLQQLNCCGLGMKSGIVIEPEDQSRNCRPISTSGLKSSIKAGRIGDASVSARRQCRPYLDAKLIAEEKMIAA